MPTTLCIVDDDPDDMQNFCEAVSKINRDYKCLTYTGGADVLQSLKQEKIKPSFIFMEFHMHRMNGKECLRKMKEIPSLAQVPVIIWSTSHTKKEIEEVLNLGAFAFLIKPNNFSALINVIKQIIEI
jgi:CheY-like chemotaxis protein